MATLTIRLPDDTHERLRLFARHRDLSVNKLMEELATASLASFDTETRFRTRAALGTPQRGLELLDKLDASFGPKT